VTPSSDGTGAVAPAAFRAVMSLLASGVAVISVRDPRTGRPRGMTANALMSVSLHPPLIVVSVRQQARLHAALEAAAAYGVTVLGEGQQAQARRFAGMPVAGHESAPAFSHRSGIPVLDGGLAWIVSRVRATHPAGDHTLFVAEIVDLGSDRPGDPPLAFHRSAFARLTPAGPHEAAPLLAWEAGLDMWG
jgi:flavin reductase (DIM6/NTAB) family NADH-FMN oxidoreductase RutF